MSQILKSFKMKLKLYQSIVFILIISTTAYTAAQEQKGKRHKLNKHEQSVALTNGTASLNSDSKLIELTGEITDTGGSNILEQGFVFSLSNETPTITDQKIAVNTTNFKFNSTLENLQPNTVYYVRSYVVNAIGVAYGSVQTIDTSSLSDIKIDLKTRLKTYPNPSTNFISLSGLAESKNYIIYSMQGKEMARGIISSDNKIDVRSLANGLYILKLENLEMVKFIKE